MGGPLPKATELGHKAPSPPASEPTKAFPSPLRHHTGGRGGLPTTPDPRAGAAAGSFPQPRSKEASERPAGHGPAPVTLRGPAFWLPDPPPRPWAPSVRDLMWSPHGSLDLHDEVPLRLLFIFSAKTYSYSQGHFPLPAGSSTIQQLNFSQLPPSQGSKHVLVMVCMYCH